MLPLATDRTHPDVPNRDTVLMEKHDSLDRFRSILWPLAVLYNLPPLSVHIFLDLHSGTVAFNRNGSIFLNFRFYEEWRKRKRFTISGLH